MFTPEGYVSWHELLDAVEHWTLQIVSRSILPPLEQSLGHETTYESPLKIRDRIHLELVNLGKVDDISEATFAMNVMELWVLANFMDLNEATLCSPDGRTLRCPPILKAHGDAFDWWSWPLSEEKFGNGEAYGYLRGFRAGSFGIGSARKRFVALDYDTGCVCLKPNTVNLLRSASYGHGENERELRRFIDGQIRPILGWSICWNPEVFWETEKEQIESIGFVDLDWSDITEDQPKSVSGNDSRRNIVECVMSAYPDGKGADVWSTVVDKVGYSRRSIVRALKADGLYETWAKGGQNQSK